MEHEVGGHVACMGQMKYVCNIILLEEVKRRDHFDSLYIIGRIILLISML
jgi:hypothetical protein